MDYIQLKGKVFQKKDGTPAFNFKEVNGDKLVEFTVRESHKKFDGTFETNYYNCNAWKEMCDCVAANLQPGDGVIITASGKDSEYNGKIRTKYRVWRIWKDITPVKAEDQVKYPKSEQQAFNGSAIEQGVQQMQQAFAQVKQPQATGDEVEIPW